MLVFSTLYFGGNAPVETYNVTTSFNPIVFNIWNKLTLLIGTTTLVLYCVAGFHLNKKSKFSFTSGGVQATEENT
ncbi:hypothetical protein L596_026688 [Steinernema carpocapsae]|uniref:Uncharacterized protein n=1 Tax=Steinernema carpocapsae TaxID=34508 RepID=A0A4U5M255_STECR|nr:hypothetical protein L596_026688 [Steinernema carpocapsae]